MQNHELEQIAQTAKDLVRVLSLGGKATARVRAAGRTGIFVLSSHGDGLVATLEDLKTGRSVKLVNMPGRMLDQNVVANAMLTISKDAAREEFVILLRKDARRLEDLGLMDVEEAAEFAAAVVKSRPMAPHSWALGCALAAHAVGEKFADAARFGISETARDEQFFDARDIESALNGYLLEKYESGSDEGFVYEL